MSMNKTDRNDARSSAHLVRSGWFKMVHVKSVASQELRTLLTSREFLVNKLRDHENEIRGALRPFGFKVGKISASSFERRLIALIGSDARATSALISALRPDSTKPARSTVAAASPRPAMGSPAQHCSRLRT